MNTIKYDGTGFTAAGIDFDPYDMWCPECGDALDKTFNYWKKKCEVRQADPNQPDCYQTCSTKAKLKVREDKGKVGVRGIPLTAENTKTLHNMILDDAGYTVSHISEALGLAKRTVSKHRETLWKELLPQYEAAGMSRVDIAKKTGARQRTITRILGRERK